MTDFTSTVRMERRENSGCNFDGGFNTLICQDDLHDEEHPSYSPSNQNRQQVFMSKMTQGRHGRLAVVSLVALAALLLIVDISLGINYNKLKDTHLATDDTERIEKEMNKLQDAYKTAIENTETTKKQLNSEMGRQKETNWELEHQTKRKHEYEIMIDKITQDIASKRSHLPMIKDGCKHCPAGWILMNLMCYYFPFLGNTGLKTWQKSREFCQMHGGDLMIIDSKDKENSTVNVLLKNVDPSTPNTGFWFGLRDFHEEGTWKWLNGSVLVEGYWNDGEPNNINNEDCAAVYPRENYFKAWNDVSCGATMKWICEKAPI
ncbi:C-type lectin domain family 4 member M-like [Toxotes jaculatrix]|uniref:C-type lectin domain family 4 member M-like n=1 Tax=Toxotes jaculatrix TaxID=941984 RepID=UPI001B3AC02D|nr:C-type lectin domain family 4 member M-like [Toxotes jaculatrix]